MSDTAAQRITARELLLAGYCSPPCLLALITAGSCRCRCDGSGHGLLSDTEVDFDMTASQPGPPMLLAAPSLECDVCSRVISKNRMHLIVGGADLPNGKGPDRDLHVVGPCCWDRKGGTSPLHRNLWPSCPIRWHDIYDHYGMGGTRAGVAAALGLPRP